MNSSPFHTLLCKLLGLVPTELDAHAAQSLGIQGNVWCSCLSWVCLGSCTTFRFYFFISVGRGLDFLNSHQLWGLKLCLLLLTAVGLHSGQCLVILTYDIIISCHPGVSWRGHLKFFSVLDYELDFWFRCQAAIPVAMTFKNVFVTAVYAQESLNLHFFSLGKEILTLQKTSVTLAAVYRCECRSRQRYREWQRLFAST